MRKFLYPLLVALYFCASSDSFAQLTDSQIAKAENTYKFFNTAYGKLKVQVQEQLHGAKKAETRNIRYDYSQYEGQKDRAIRLYDDTVALIKTLYESDKANKGVKTLCKKAQSKWNELDSLPWQIEKIKNTL
jgi:hypothetical protein